MLSLKNITFKSRSKKILLNEISFDAAQKEILGILGPSGAGKSTIFKIISGLIKPNNGKITLNKRDIINLPVNKRSISFMQQTFPLYNNMSVLENVNVALELDNNKINKEDRKSSTEMLKLLGISNRFFDRGIDNLSGGESQRIALAKALLKPSKILLLDEPFSNVDKNYRRYLSEVIRDIVNRRNLICLFISHNEDDILLTSDKIIVLDTGILVQSGTHDELINKPKTSNVAALGLNTGIQIISINSHIRNKFLNILPNKCTKIGWRSESSHLKIENKKSDLKNSKQLILSAKIKRITKIGILYYINLLIDGIDEKSAFWHIEYKNENIISIIKSGDNVRLLINFEDILLLDKDDNILNN